jgi:hypothetical protein
MHQRPYPWSKRRQSRSRRSPQDQREGEAAQERPKSVSRQPKWCRSPQRRLPLIIPRCCRHILGPTPLLLKSKRVNSRSVSRAGIAIKRISNLLHLSPAWSVAEALLTPTICGLPNRARWDARSATNLQCPCAERIIGTTIISETKLAGGRVGLLIPSRHRGCSGFRRVGLNEGDRSFLSSLPEASQKRKDGDGVLGSWRRCQCPINLMLVRHVAALRIAAGFARRFASFCLIRAY